MANGILLKVTGKKFTHQTIQEFFYGSRAKHPNAFMF